MILTSALLRLFGLNSPSFDPVRTLTSMSVTDVTGNSGRHTDPVQAVRYLKSYGVRMIIDLPNILKIWTFLFSKDHCSLTFLKHCFFRLSEYW